MSQMSDDPHAVIEQFREDLSDYKEYVGQHHARMNQRIATLEDTYGKERAHALLSGMVTVIGLRTADNESVDFLRETIGTSFERYTRNSGDDRTPSESEEKEKYQFAKGDFGDFDPGEAVICRQGDGWVHCRIQLLEE